MRFLKGGMPEKQAKLVLEGAMLAVPDHLRDLKNSATQDGRWQSRYDDIPRAISTARAKIVRPGPTSAPLLDPWNALQPPPFRIDALPGTLRRFVDDRANALAADPCAIAWASLSACSSALDARIRLRMKKHDKWSVPPMLWVALVGRVSAKKTPIVDAAWAPLQAARAVNLQRWRDELRDWNATPLKERGEKPWPRRRLATNDSTIEALQEILGR